MSNTLGIDFAADVGEMASDLGATLTYGSESVLVLVGASMRQDPIAADLAGTEPDNTIPCIGEVADFTTVPPIRATVGLNGSNWLVIEREYNEDSTVVRFRLKAKE